MKASYQFHDHTADVLFTAKAPTLEGLFEQAALAVEETMVELADVKNRKKQEIKIKAQTPEKLLFDFLNELIFYKDASQLLFSEFSIKINKNSGYDLHCLAQGEKINTVKHRLKVDIKAITLHLFEVKYEHKIWKAQVIMDI